ncbi:hypothetical protein TH25_19785 [Thalassospira profundimaris]|uniref:DUF4123 domain-containing protein n=1 Tax=Thalassospira profundimaris TaxID=502049 RepID=A0A367WSH0_9PROT|nr:hypothetical protein TH25_19785 [Thalassospira profundimaris]
MGEFEAWIADCYLQNGDKGQRYCQAVVWADSYETFNACIAEYAENAGLKILWLEECLPVRQYLTRHGNLHKIGPLARAVHPGHVVELGSMLAIDADHTPEPSKSWLTIKEIKDIEPLGGQIGVWPEKNIPDLLFEPLFGPVEPTRDEVALYGSVGAVPPMRTYVVLDTSKLQWGYDEIEGCEMRFQCLFKGNAANELKNAAPYLIELDPENRFTRRLFTYVPEMPDEMTSLHLWHKEPGIYIRSRDEFDTVWKHLRKFPRMQDDKGQWYFFRFWEPCVLRDYLCDLRYEAGKIVNWFGRRAAELMIITISGGVLHSFALAETIPVGQKSESILLEREAYARQHARRVMGEFAEEQGIPFKWETYDAYDYPWKDFELEDLKIITLLHGYFGVMEKYPTDGMYPEGMQHEARRRDLLGRFLFFKAQGVPYGL